MKDILVGQRGVRMQKLTTEDCRRIHEASLRLLANVGVEVHHEGALEIFREAGASVDGTRVRLHRELVEWALEVSPNGFTLHDRGGAPVMPVTGTNVFFGPGSETPQMLDHRTGERRNPVLADVAEGIRVVDALPNIDFMMSLFVPWDLDPSVAYVEQFKTMLMNSTKPPLMVTPSPDDVNKMVGMLEAIAGGEQQLREKPRGMLYINVTHPFRHEFDDVEKAIFAARKGLPFTYNPTVLRGANSPITVASGLAVAVAGEMIGLVLSQLVSEGAPFAFALSVDKLDMRSMVDVYSAPENRVTFVEMANFYDKPHFGLGGSSDSKVVDEQSVGEAVLSLLTEAMAGSNLVHDVGYMESGISNSLVQLAICDEFIGWVRRFMDATEVSDETLQLDLIERVAPMGDYLSEDHTLEHFSEDWYPKLLDQSTCDRWLKQGGKTLRERAEERVDHIIETHQVEPLAPEILAAIDSITEQEQHAS